MICVILLFIFPYRRYQGLFIIPMDAACQGFYSCICRLKLKPTDEQMIKESDES